jgi:hypothetical protein
MEAGFRLSRAASGFRFPASGNWAGAEVAAGCSNSIIVAENCRMGHTQKVGTGKSLKVMGFWLSASGTRR